MVSEIKEVIPKNSEKYGKQRELSTPSTGIELQMQHFIPKRDIPLQGVTETINASVAGYFFPETEFQIGHMDAATAKEEDLMPRRGLSLEFSSGDRLYYANEQVGSKVFPKASDRAAYGSLPFTPLSNLIEIRQCKVLVIDDQTGDSGGVLKDREAAKRLVGDCHGKMNKDIAQSLSGQESAPVQFRLGIKPQEGCDVYRIAKGTLAPSPYLHNLRGAARPGETLTQDKAYNDLSLANKPEQLSADYQSIVHNQFDLILATSMFKGRKGDDAIKPGEYTLDIGIGAKSVAQYRKQRLGVQALVNYPQAVEKDILPIVKEKSQELVEAVGDTAKLAQLYIDWYEEKQEQGQNIEKGSDEDVYKWLTDSFTEDPSKLSREESLYEILKTDLQHHGQMLEHPFVVEELKKFTQSRWQDLAFNGGIKFKSGMAQPCDQLKDNEICCPNLPAGEEIIVTRSPLVNSNGVIVMTNRHIPEIMIRDGAVGINQKSALDNLQCDFDGDVLAYELASKYPTLTKEIKEKTAPENRYPDIVKAKKQEYTGTFESIAIQCATDQIGTIANVIMRAEALRNTTLACPSEKKAKLVQWAARYYDDQLQGRVKYPIRFPDRYKKPMLDVASLRGKQLDDKTIEQAFEAIREIQRQAVTDAGNQLQIAVDGPKSAARPDENLIKICKRAAGFMRVDVIDARKDNKAYLDYAARTNTYSPIDMMANEVNQHYTVCALAIRARPAHTFADLVPKPDDSYLARAKQIKHEYSAMLSAAVKMKETMENRPLSRFDGVEITSEKGDIKVRVTTTDNLEKYEKEHGVDILSQAKRFKLELLAPNHPDRRKGYDVGAHAKVGEDRVYLGPIQDLDKSELYKTMIFEGKASYSPALTESLIDAKFQAINDYVANLQQEYPEGPRRSEMAKALWHCAHNKTEHLEKKAILGVTIFPKETLQHLEVQNIDQIKVVGLQHDSNQHRGEALEGQKLFCQMQDVTYINAKDQEKTSRFVAVDGKPLGAVGGESFGFPPGTIFQGEFTPDKPSHIEAKFDDDLTLKIKNVDKTNFQDIQFTGKPKNLEICNLGQKFPSYHAYLNLGNRSLPNGASGRQYLGEIDTKNKANLAAINKALQTIPPQPVTLPNNKQVLARVVSAELTSPQELKTGIITVDQDSIRYPWKRDIALKTEPEHVINLEVGAARSNLAHLYEAHAEKARELGVTEKGRKLDKAVALLAFKEGTSPDGVAAILSQSPSIQDNRPQEGTPEFEQYKQEAKEYTKDIIKEVANYIEKKRSQAIAR